MFELPLLPFVEAWSVSISGATTSRGFDRQGRATAPKYGGSSKGIIEDSSRGRSAPDGVIDQTSSESKTRPGTMAPLKRKRHGGSSNASTNSDSIVDVDGDQDSGPGGTSSLSVPFPTTLDSSKRKRDLDWGVGTNNIGAETAVAADGTSEAVERFDLFVPDYGKRCQGRGVIGEDEETR